MDVAVTAEQRAIASAIHAWAGRMDPIGAVRGIEAGSSPPTGLWSGLVDLGLFAMALSEEQGGAGGSLGDLAAALGAVTETLVPGPATPTVHAALILAGDPQAKELIPVLAGGAPAAVAFDGVLAGGARLNGTLGPILGARPDSHLVLPTQTGWVVLEPGHPGVTVTARRPTDFSRPLADVTLSDVEVPADRVLPAVSTDRVRDLAATLYAVEAAAVAHWCVRTAADHAKVRQQFGRPIGSFQAVKHLCAELLCRAERAAAVAWDAARAPADEAPLAAAVAAGVAMDAAVDNAKDCIQVLGGIGFTWDHDAHLYLRRALSIRQLVGGTARWRRRAAALTVAGMRRRLTVDLGAAAHTGIRQRVRDIAAHLPEQQRAALADAGYIAPQWPEPYGLDASPATQLVIDAELADAGLTRPDLTIGAWAVPTILAGGTDAQKDRFAGPTLRGDLVWCQLFSEPEAGSDLASLRTRAVRVDGGWRLTGQKVWTSLAREADWAICLARTDPDAPKHRGLTYFLVKMDSPGLDIRPLREITGRSVFNEVFLDDVFVPDDCVVGAPGDGWRLARGTLATERVAMSQGSSLGDNVEALVASAAEPSEDLGALVADGLALSLLDFRATLAQLDGQEAGALSAVRKLVGVRHRQSVAEAALVQSGPDGADAETEALHEFLLTRCLSIAGGTTQILLSLVGERVLGLPRDEVR